MLSILLILAFSTFTNHSLRDIAYYEITGVPFDVKYEVAVVRETLYFRVAGAVANWFGIAFSKNKAMDGDQIVLIYEGPTDSNFVQRLGNHSPGSQVGTNEVIFTPLTTINNIHTFEAKINMTSFSLWDFSNQNAELPMLVAYGSGKYNFHKDESIISGLSIASIRNQTANANIKKDSLSTRKKLHAIFMASAWGIFAPVAILASGFKNLIPALKTTVEEAGFLFDRTQIWFRIHKSCNYIVVLFTVIGFLLGYLESTTPHFSGTGDYLSHKRNGLIVCCIAVIQPLLGIIRPSKLSDLRTTWLAAHTCLGSVCLVLGLLNIYYGMKIIENDISWDMSGLEMLSKVWLCIISFMYFATLVTRICCDSGSDNANNYGSLPKICEAVENKNEKSYEGALGENVSLLYKGSTKYRSCTKELEC